MKLEKFQKKDPKKKTLIFGGILFLLFLTIMIVYRSFAFFEENQEFNIIKGQVPDQYYDVLLSLTEEKDGIKTQIQEIPEKENGKKYNVEVLCDETDGYWDYQDWNIVINVKKTRTKCKINFKEEETFEYPSPSTDYEIVSFINYPNAGGGVPHSFSWNANLEPYQGKKITGIIVGHIVGYKFCSPSNSNISYKLYINDNLIYNKDVVLKSNYNMEEQMQYYQIIPNLEILINENTTMRVEQKDDCGSPGGVYVYGILN